jgi:hypothetical protein
MEQREVKDLLSALREAVNAAILGSHNVSAALAALNRTGVCPNLEVGVSFGEQNCGERRAIQQCFDPGGLVLTAADREFLRSFGVTVETARDIAREAA